jgi:hypothetical protein
MIDVLYVLGCVEGLVTMKVLFGTILSDSCKSDGLLVTVSGVLMVSD